MRGYADIHVHMFANLAFGGAVLAGAPYHPSQGIGGALGPDYGTDLPVVGSAGEAVPAPCLPTSLLYDHCGRNLLHGDHVGLIDDPMGTGTSDGTRSFFGAPIFSGWPTWHSTTHQQVYYRWLERAFRGGLRLMTMLAVNNEEACNLSRHLRSATCKDSMPGIDQQLDAARAFQTWLDAQPGGGWFKIVETPDEAEQTIRAGKLAVVLGIEVDTLFGCRFNNTCTPESVAAEVDRYYAKGVRHIFPTHDFDGGFAGTALFIPLLNTANLVIEGQLYDGEPCPGVSDLYLGCNKKGLSEKLGAPLINKLMDKGMLIDIDHMSHKAIGETFTIAKARGGYPLMVGHGLFAEEHAAGKNRHERMRTPAELETLRELGGVVSVMTQDQMEHEPDCKHSSRSFAKNLVYAVDKMGGPVPLGSDFNGMAPHVGPRYGDDACGGSSAQRAKEMAKPELAYPFTLPGFGTFSKQVTDQRTFDFNTDGLAHIGLEPDLIADLMLEVQPAYIEQMMHSAKAYVDAWRRAQAKGTGPLKP
jgi:microsomal dipeptidase-like Zn-dependent dipeptidase